jgi:hypothetical protein
MITALSVNDDAYSKQRKRSQVLEEVARRDEAHDLVGALENAVHTHIPYDALQGVVLEVPKADTHK